MTYSNTIQNVSFGKASDPVSANTLQVSMHEFSFLLFIKQGLNKAVQDKVPQIFLGSSKQMQEDFRSYLAAHKLNQKFTPEQTTLHSIIASLWTKMSNLYPDQSISQINNVLHEKEKEAGYMFSLQQAQMLIKIADQSSQELLKTYGSKS